MPAARAPRRRPVRALGSLQLLPHANIPTKVITELAYMTDERLNSPDGSTQAEYPTDMPLEVPFEDFMTGVNSRGRGTQTRQRKMTVEQVVTMLLVMVQKGHVELIAETDDPLAIETIKILPEAKKKLAGFLPKLRGYGDVPYDQEYRGAIALAKRHFFPSGKLPTKRELVGLLLRCQQDSRKLELRSQPSVQRPTMRTLSIQTSLAKIEIGASSDTGVANEVEEDQPMDSGLSGIPETVDQPSLQDGGEMQSNDTAQNPTDGQDGEMSPEPEMEPVASVSVVPCTPAPTRFVNPYMTPVSNPRHGDHARAVSPDSSPTPSTSAPPMVFPDIETSTVADVKEMLQATAMSQGMLSWIVAKFNNLSQKVTTSEAQKNEFQRRYERTQRQLNETEQRLWVANVEKWNISQWARSIFFGQLNSIQGQISILDGMVGTWQEPATAPATNSNSDEWIVHDAGA